MKRASLIISAVLMTAMLFISCGNKGYKEVKIGNQIWMAENLNVDKFRNGDPIPQVKTAEKWAMAGSKRQPAWCYYGNDPDNGKLYGKLYNWYAVNDPRGLAPVGWRIPTDNDWSRMVKFLGGERAVSNKIKNSSGWYRGNGTNESGFSGLPGGFRNIGEFRDIGLFTGWWSSTEYSTTSSIFRPVSYDNYVGYQRNTSKRNGYYVRVLRE